MDKTPNSDFKQIDVGQKPQVDDATLTPHTHADGAANQMLNDSGFSAPSSSKVEQESESALHIAEKLAAMGVGVLASAPGRVGFVGKTLSLGIGVAAVTDMALRPDARGEDVGALVGIASGFALGKLTGIYYSGMRSVEAKTVSELPVAARELQEFSVPGLKFKNTKLVSEIETTLDGPMPKTYEEYKDNSWTFTQPAMNIFQHERTGTDILFPKAKSDYDRLGLDQVTRLADRFPDPRLVKAIHVSDQPHPDEAWMRSQLDRPAMKIGADVKTDGILTLYRPGVDTNLNLLSNHEWSHLHELDNPEASKLFADLGSVERGTPPSSAVQEIGSKEPWPSFAETYLGDDGVLAAATAMRSPLRASIWSKTFENDLSQVPPEFRSPAHNFYESRAQLVKEGAAPDVAPALKSMQQSDDPEERALANRVSDFLSN